MLKPPVEVSNPGLKLVGPSFKVCMKMLFKKLGGEIRNDKLVL